MNNKELIGKAEKGEWNLECDEEVLNQMKNVSQKLESRSANTRSNMNTMMLGVDETKVKLNNLSKINSIKNTHYCENLIRDDESIDDSSDNMKKDNNKNEPVKLTQQVAIENGMKLMENCFEKHRVNFDPSSNSEVSTVYRPIDKYANVLPHLIGSDKWNEKWHVGLLDKDSSVEKRPVSSLKDNEVIDQSSLNTTLRDSLESISKSVSSIGDQMVINKPSTSGIFDDTEDEIISSDPIVPNPNSTQFFRPQQDQRRIVNLFNDEPPSLESSPAATKKPVNLFDDYGSVDSFPTSDISDDKTTKIPIQPPPVDLFNDSEFDNFIDNMEKQQQKKGEDNVENSTKSVKISAEKSVKSDMKLIADEIKKVQLKKTSSGVGDVESVVKKSSENKSLDFKQMLSQTLEKQQQVVGGGGDVKPKSKPKKVDEIQTPPPIVDMKAKKTVANLFDDDEDEEDFNSMKKVEVSKPNPPIPHESEVEKSKKAQKKKLTNLFDDDDDEDDPFEDIFKKKLTAESKPITKSVSKKLFEDDDDVKSIASVTKMKSMFSDDNEKVGKKTSSFTPSPPFIEEDKREVGTSNVVKDVKEKVVEQLSKVIDQKAIEKTSQTTSSVSQDKENVEKSSKENEKVSPKLIKKVVDVEVEKKLLESSSFKPFNVPFLNDEPPDDDKWETESHNFEDTDHRPPEISSPKTSSYSSVPLFDEIPPEDDFASSSKPPIPEPNFYSEDDDEPIKFVEAQVKKKIVFEKTKDESDNSSVSVGIKGKLDDLFKKKQEKDSAAAKDSPKKLPGKLSSDLKINVGALMPGVRIPIKKVSEQSSDETEQKSLTSSTPTKNKDDESQVNMLNNEITKSRAKIQVKRRPSTRKARHESYQKTMSAYYAEEESEIKEETTNVTRPMSAVFSASESVVTKSSVRKEVKSSTSKKVESSSIFGESDDDVKVTKTSKESVKTNKISVFYDDEEETKKMLEQQQTQNTKEIEEKTESSHKSSSVFDQKLSDDDELFCEKSTKTKNLSAQKATTSSKSKSLFDDDDDDGDIFVSKTATKKSSKIFESDDEENNLTTKTSSSSKLKTDIPKKQSKSLFGDDSDDDDDLFSSKPKSTKSTNQEVKSSSSTIVKKSTSKAVDDPLSRNIWND